MKWYVLHTQTGSEEKVKIGLENKLAASAEEIRTLVSQVVIPTEQVSEIKSGKKKISQRKFFPGYVLVQMELNDATWYLVKSTPGITGFIGLGRQPSPISEEEVERILQKTHETQAKPSPKVTFDVGEAVRVIEGPFINFNGTVDEIHQERGKIKVGVSIFGRVTPVELEFWQVEKI